MIYKSVGRQNGFESYYNNVKVQLARVRCILSHLFPGLLKKLNDAAVVYFQLLLIYLTAIHGRHLMARHIHTRTHYIGTLNIIYWRKMFDLTFLYMFFVRLIKVN